MTIRVHIVGSMPRSGTTLAYELIVNCFEIDGTVEHEQSLLTPYNYRHKIYCTKLPRETCIVKPLLNADKTLWVLCVVRDPRDSVSSHSHRKKEGKYYAKLASWHARYPVINQLINHPRFILLKYEDLVSEPDTTQKNLQKRMPFLKCKHRFSEFHIYSKSSKDAIDALAGIRPINRDSIGSWHSHKDNLIRQIHQYGDISDDLIELGYEQDKEWLHSLFGTNRPDIPIKARKKSDISISEKLLLIRKYATYLLCRYTPLRSRICMLRAWMHRHAPK